MTISALFKRIDSGNIPHVCLVVGKQPYLNKMIKHKFTSIIPKSERSMNLVSFNMESAPLDYVLGDVSSIPFMGKYHLTFMDKPFFMSSHRDKFLSSTVKKFKNNRSKMKKYESNFIKYLKHPVPSTILVIMAPYSKIDKRRKLNKALLKYATVLDINNISPQAVMSYTGSQINNNGYHIDNGTLNYLLQRTNNNLSDIMISLPKLFSYCSKSKQITNSAIDELIPKSLDQNVFDLVSRVLNMNISGALHLYHGLLISGNDPLQLHGLLVSQFRIMLQTKIYLRSNKNQWDIAKLLKQNPYRIKYVIRDAHPFNIDQLAYIYKLLFNDEISLKSGNKDPELLLEMLMTQYQTYITENRKD